MFSIKDTRGSSGLIIAFLVYFALFYNTYSSKMKGDLLKLIEGNIILEYKLPNKVGGIERSVISTDDDHCYKSNNENDLAKIIHNSIVHYSFDSFEFTTTAEVLFNRALNSRIRFSEGDDDSTKLNYGFFGEVLLYAMLSVIYKVPPLISKGHFTLVGNGESKGYDSYHMIQDDKGNIDLWFGEVKFRESSSSGIKSALENLETKLLTDDYFKNNNLIPIFDELNKNPEYSKKFIGSKILEIKNKWIEKGILDLSDFKKHKIKLVYPILISYNKSTKGYDQSITNAVNYIKDKYSSLTISGISIPSSLFFIFLPVENVGAIKKQVLSWIKLNESLI